MTYTASQF